MTISLIVKGVHNYYILKSRQYKEREPLAPSSN